MNFIVEPNLSATADLRQPDHLAGLRAQRREHFRNAVWWKKRYQAWGGNMELQWFLSEARSHRYVNRIIWTMGKH